VSLVSPDGLIRSGCLFAMEWFLFDQISLISFGFGW
jgi:hypothetical protein